MEENDTYSETVCLTVELIEDFLQSLETSGRKKDTIAKYRRDMKSLYRFLPDDKLLDSNTLKSWMEYMLDEEKAPRTINSCLSAANSFMDYIGKRNWQIKRLEENELIKPELTRSEYLRLLQTAKLLRKERLYLLIKVFGSTGITVSSLPEITVEAAEAGNFTEKKRTVHIPECLRTELIEYADKREIISGPIFVTKSGQPIDRTNVCNSMKQLCRDAHVDEEKVNPRCLKKLYEDTYSGIRSGIDMLVEQAYDRMLEKEQQSVGWEAKGA